MGNFSESLQIGKDKDGKKVLLRHLNSKLYSIEEYRNCINKEINQGKQLEHPNLPLYIGLCKDETGEAVEFKYVAALPLYKAVLENSFNLNTKKECANIVNQIIDATEYMHQNGILHLNINPGSIYISKGNNRVTLFNPLSYYIDKDISYATFNGFFSDPTLFSDENTPNERDDIYSIGKTIEYIYSYSDITPWTKYIIKKATHSNPEKRYANVGELKRDLSRSKIADIITNSLKICAIIAVVIIGFTMLMDDSPTKENYEFREETNLRHKVEKSDEETNTTISINEIDTVVPIARRSLDLQKESESIFKKEFRSEASKIINQIYTKEMMSASPEKFQEVSIKKFADLDAIQKKMALEYNLSFAFSAKLAAEVIEELTQKRLQELNKK